MAPAVEHRRGGVLRHLTIPIAGVILAMAPGAHAQSLETKLDAKKAALTRAQEERSVLSSELADYSAELERLAAEVAVLRNRETVVAEELRAVTLELSRLERHLAKVRRELVDSFGLLRRRLVDIYVGGEAPDMMTVLLESDGFDDLISRYDYLQRIQEQDAALIARVRGLRDRTRSEVAEVEVKRAEIAARRAELARTRSQLEARQAELDAARRRKASALVQVKDSVVRLQGDVGDLEERIQQRLQAAQTAPTEPLAAGPVQGSSTSGLIWPVSGPLTSPFGPRWGRLHAGIDIAAPGGTPIRAADGGTVTLAEPYGGYGNYTCLDHGGGLSTCYAHQSAFEITSGTVDQGQVIGYVGNTGASFGDHLHFEIRVGGGPVDPLGYL